MRLRPSRQPPSRRHSPALAAALLLALPATDLSAAAPDRAALSGLYGNVKLSAVTGDLGGVEIEIHADTAEPYAFVTVCEGWCNAYYRVPLQVDGRRFEFDFVEALFHADGTPAEPFTSHFKGRLAGRDLIIENRRAGLKYRLKPQKERFGLNVARPSEEIP